MTAGIKLYIDLFRFFGQILRDGVVTAIGNGDI